MGDGTATSSPSRGLTWPWPGLHLQMHQQRANLTHGESPVEPAILDHALETWGSGWGAVYPEMGLAVALAEVSRAAEDLGRVTDPARGGVVP